MAVCSGKASVFKNRKVMNSKMKNKLKKLMNKWYAITKNYKQKVIAVYIGCVASNNYINLYLVSGEKYLCTINRLDQYTEFCPIENSVNFSKNESKYIIEKISEKIEKIKKEITIIIEDNSIFLKKLVDLQLILNVC